MGTSEPTTSLLDPETLLVEFARVFEPLDEAVREGPEGVARLLDRAGAGEGFQEGELEAFHAAVVDDLGESLPTLRRLVLDPLREGAAVDIDATDVDDLVNAVAGTYSGIRHLRSVDVEAVDSGEVGDRVLDYLLVTYLHRDHRPIHDALCLIGVIEEGRPPTLDLSQFPAFLRDPVGVPADAMGWGTEHFTGFLVLFYLREICWRAGIPATLTDPPKPVVEDLVGRPMRSNELEPELKIPVVSFVEERASTSVGVRIVPIPGNPDNDLPGFVVVPFGVGAASETVDLGDGWTFNVESTAEQTDWGIAAWPDSDTADTVNTRANVIGEGEQLPEIDLEVALAYDGRASSDGVSLLGDPDGSRIAVQYTELSTSIEFDDGEAIFQVTLPARGTLAVDPSELDDFLASMLPSDGLVYDFDVTVGWSSNRGLFFERGSGHEVSLPQQGRLGPVRLTELYLGVVPSADTDEVTLEGAASADVEFGPVTGTITRMGVVAEVQFPENLDGNLGPIDLDVGVKPPDGIGLSIDSGVVTGGGFLRFDPEHERYAGVVQLQVGDLALNAVGLLTNRLPDESQGFSLLVLVAGEFTPIRLGLGFTLNGVGGLLGVNRTVRSAALGEAVRQGSLESILFPEDPVENATRIVSDLGAVFPPKRDHHVFGPMAKIAWGTPPLVTADLGIVVQFPSSDVTLLGRVNAVLPEAGVDPLVDLNVGIAGQVVPAEQRAAFDASLYDSHIGTWTATGDAALRSRWGAKPWFLLSVGGVNPRYDSPTDLPDLDRIAISGTPSTGFPRFEIEGYVALTSNTAQTGADVWIGAEAGPATVEGEIGFDALFRFDPFEFVVDFSATVAVKVYGKGLTLGLDGTVSGPAPWRVTGTIHVDLFFFDVTETMTVTVGPERASPPLPSTRVMPKLVAALENPDNWTAQRPTDGQSVVNLRDIGADGRVLAHPLGRLGVRQTVVPLDFELDKVGNTRPAEFTQFTIDGVAIEGTDGDDSSIAFDRTVREHFAPAQYEDLTETQKLSRPAFERLPAGREVTAERVVYGGETADEVTANTRTTTLTYETSVIDKRRDVHAMELAELGSFASKAEATVSIPQATADALSAVSAVARADTRTTGSARFRLPEQPPGRTDPGDSGLLDADRPATRGGTYLAGPVSMDEANYVVVRADDLAPTSIGSAEERPTVMRRSEAEQALDRHLTRHPEDEGDLRVVEASAVRGMSQARSDDEPDHSLTVGDLLQ
ncbi:DUF6603 domain-containing protein [Natrinema gelatinilyticum]|uniref:DUF6603 domain-containing protein n=1 Tax=Natrinema gelatinilyticum TaxID=2961571 RepID=UPI0020C241CF|nr:DUF6603 domain-containing protein [Natrinema gelatinilyticum]